jgi:hypothetical protein
LFSEGRCGAGGEKLTSGAKARLFFGTCGTAEAVPLSKTETGNDGMRGFFAALRMTNKENRQQQGRNTEILASPE